MRSHSGTAGVARARCTAGGKWRRRGGPAPGCRLRAKLLPGGGRRGGRSPVEAVELQLHGRPALVLDELPGQGRCGSALEDGEAGAAGNQAPKPCLGSGRAARPCSSCRPARAACGANSPMFPGPRQVKGRSCRGNFLPEVGDIWLLSVMPGRRLRQSAPGKSAAPSGTVLT